MSKNPKKKHSYRLFLGWLAVLVAACLASCGYMEKKSLQNYWSDTKGQGVTLDLRDPSYFTQKTLPNNWLKGRWHLGKGHTIDFDYEATETEEQKHRTATYTFSPNHQILVLTFENGEELELTYGP